MHGVKKKLKYLIFLVIVLLIGFFSVNIAGVFVQSLLYITLLYAHGSSYKFAEEWTNDCSERSASSV